MASSRYSSLCVALIQPANCFCIAYVQKRKQASLAAARLWREQKAKGSGEALESIKGFARPYNDVWWALAHQGIPFNCERQGVAQGAGVLSDFVIQHPLVLAENMQITQYKSESFSRHCST
jgi:hypothetical protein